MLRLLSDQNFNLKIVAGFLRRNPTADVLDVRVVGLDGADDPSILAWAAENGRIVLTHDKATMPDFANRRVEAGEAMPGVFVVSTRAKVAQVIDDLEVLNDASEQSEWANLVIRIPLPRPPA